MRNLLTIASGMFALFTMISCEADTSTEIVKDIQKKESIEELAMHSYRLPTKEELKKFEELGIWTGESMRSQTCEWSDGQYGSVECSGGRCGILLVPAPEPSHACIMCYQGGEPHHAGACRPIE